MIIALNNKSNLNKDEFLEYQQQLATLKTNSKIILCPTFLNINLMNLTKIYLGAQNVSCNDKGAYTGEISAKDLKESEVDYCIVGHSERRENQKESLEEIHNKIIKLLEADIVPILCIGETKEERDNHLVEKVLERELTSALEGLTDEQKRNIIIAYEPIWSIGTGVIPTLDEIEDAFLFIKKLIPNTPILYGGSANEKNIGTLKQSPLIEGYLVGGLSLKPTELQQFINILENRN